MEDDYHEQMRTRFEAAQHLIHLSVCDSDLAHLQTLLGGEGLDINNDDSWEQAPLTVAVQCDNLEAARILLEAGADPLHLHAHGLGCYTPLSTAARQGCLEITRLMWARIPPSRLSEHENSPENESCLVMAATYGRTGVLEYLLDGWFDRIRWSTGVLDRALLGAVAGWHVHAATLLLERVKTYTTETLRASLFVAVDFKAMEPTALESPVYQGVDFFNQELLVKRLIEAGSFDPDLCERGRPVLHYTVYAVNLVGALRAVLTKGADPHARDEKGRTALQRIAVPISTDMREDSGTHETGIHLLLEHGASTTIADYSGEMPLHVAAFGSDLYLFRRFFRSAAEDALSTTNNHGETLLHYAAAGGNIGVLRFLLEMEAAKDITDIDMPAANGWTLLHCALAPTRIDGFCPQAVRKTPQDVVHAARLLLDRGADAGRVTAEGWSALHCLACYETHAGDTRFSALAEELVRMGAPLGAKARGLREGWWSGLLWSGVKGYSPSEDGFPWGFRMGVVGEVAPEGVFEAEATTALEWAERFGGRAVERVLLERERDGESAAS